MKFNKKYRKVMKREFKHYKEERATLEAFILNQLSGYDFSEGVKYDPSEEKFIIKPGIGSYDISIEIPTLYLYRSKRKKRYRSRKSYLLEGTSDMNSCISIYSKRFHVRATFFSFKLRKFLRTLLLVKRHELFWKEVKGE